MTPTALEIAQDVRSGTRTARAFVEESLERARAAAELNALITLDEAGAVAAATRIDSLVAAGQDPGHLAGVPLVVKDNILTEGIATTAGSEFLRDFVPPVDATVVARLRAQGAVVIGKSNLDEFGMGSSNEYSAFGPVLNPWDRERVPGGSSGGSAAAVAAGITPLALGSDTGGSVRQPAAFCGVVGYKPTYGVLSRYGLIAFASSLDQVGLIGRSGGDIAAAMLAMSGRDEQDATTHPRPAGLERVADRSEPEGDLSGLRVGVVDELSGEGNDPSVLEGVERTVRLLSELGATVERVSLPRSRFGVATYYLVATAEASSNLSRFDGTLYGTRLGANGAGQAQVMTQTRGQALGREVRRRILMGTYALSAGYYDAYYGKALRVRRLLAEEFSRAFEEVDVLLTPTTPGLPFRLGARSDEPLAMYLGDVDTCLANLVGIPAISVPAGLTAEGLPRGVQFMAPPGHDARLLSICKRIGNIVGSGFTPLAPAAA